MNTAGYIFDYLNAHGEAVVPGFGRFYLKNSAAMLGSDKKTLLPPSKEVALDLNYENQQAESLASHIAAAKGISEGQARDEIAKSADYWRTQINTQNDFDIPELGAFSYNENEVVFRGKRVATDNPDFYGLEEINLQQLKKPAEPAVADKGSYRILPRLLWLSLGLAVVIGAAAVYSLGPEALFGEKSFQEKAAVKPVVKKPVVVKPVADSLATDSTKKDTLKNIVPVAAKSPAKKSYNKKNKWQKKRPRATRSQ